MSKENKVEEIKDHVYDILGEIIDIDNLEIINELAQTHEEIVYQNDVQYGDMVSHYEESEDKLSDIESRIDEIEDLDIGYIKDQMRDLQDIDLSEIRAQLGEIENLQQRISEQEEELDDLREATANLEERIEALEKTTYLAGLGD